MTRLILETALLLLGAYFLGAWAACMVKRTFFATSKAADTGMRLETAVATGRASTPAPSAPIAPPTRRPDPKPIALETIERAAPHAAADAAQRFEKVLTQAPAVAAPAAPVTKPVPAAAPTPAAPPVNRTAPAAPAPAPAPVATTGPSVAASAAAPLAPTTKVQAPTPAPVAAPLAAAFDDLTRIRAIDPSLQASLIKLGAGRYRDIAAWLPADVARVSQALGFSGRIEQENWIEQAQILARGGETAYARRKDRGEGATSAPTAGEGQPTPVLATPGAAVAAVAAAVAPAVASTAAAIPATLPRVSERAAFAEPGRTASAIPAPVPQKPAATAAPMAAVPGLAAAAASAAAAGLGATASLDRDNLQRIGGINAEIEKLLNVQGVSRYAQIAGWSADDAMRFDRLLGHEGRVKRENWMEQAQMLARGGDTAFSRQFDQRNAANVAGGASGDIPRPSRLAEAIRDTAAKAVTEPSAAATPRTSDMSSLRSVRSEAYASGSPSPAGKGGQPDDLKRVRGVGVLIEKKLISMGVTSYAQIANWSAADIDRVSQVLDFRGRIERENWVEQARILSAGGQTEFSRRVDRGEVESSKNR